MKTLCINITEDTESWELSKKEFKRVGLTAERFSATVEPNRPLAFNKSVYRAMEAALTIVDSDTEVGKIRSTKREHLLLFEDDVMFDTDRVPVHPELMPTGWLTLHYGCNIIGTSGTTWQMPTYFAPGLAKLHNAWQSHCTMYSSECVKFILENFNPNILDENNMIFDEWLRTNVLTQGRSYLMNPMIAYQRPRFSSIWNVDSDYTGCHKQGNLWLKNNL